MVDEKNKKKEPEKKGLDFDYCRRHNQPYPKGSVCPKCDEERRKKN